MMGRLTLGAPAELRPGSPVSPKAIEMGARASNLEEDLGQNPAHQGLLHGQEPARTSTDTLANGSSSLKPPSSCAWIPFTLRWPYLTALTLSSLSLGIVVIVLSVISANNSGLSDDHDSTAFLFAWRFLPTLVAVAFALAVTTLLNDVRRTEAFARLSHPTGATAKSTLLLASCAWWEDPVEACRQRRNAGVAWAYLCVALANIVAIILVSPLSAGFLFVQDVVITRQPAFHRLAAFSSSPLDLSKDVTLETDFRTISALAQNLTTSAWLKEDYAVLPFWPAELATIPFGASLSRETQQWRGPTSVFKVEMACTSMELMGANYNNDDNGSASILLASKDGCEVGYDYGTGRGIQTDGGGWWTYITGPNAYVPVNDLLGRPTHNNTQQCGDRELFFVVSGSGDFGNVTVNGTGQVCSTTYLMAPDVPVTVDIDAQTSAVSFDEADFRKAQKPIDFKLIDLPGFDSLFMNRPWGDQYKPPQTSLYISGPLLLMAPPFNANLNTMLAAGPQLVGAARLARQRFFGEALQAAFKSISQKNAESISAKLLTTRPRLVVAFGVGLALGIIMILSAALIATVYYFSRLSRRPLNLRRDPGTVAAIMLMTMGEAETRHCFRGFERMPEEAVDGILGNTTFRLANGKLVVIGDGKADEPDYSTAFKPRTRVASILRSLGLTEASRLGEDWRPAILRRWTGMVLLAFIATLVGGLVALYVVSRTTGLHQTFFVYQGTLNLGSYAVSYFTPTAIIPTLIAVILKLWWGAIEDTFKRLQPYALMVKRPTSIDEGITLSYINSPMVVAAVRASLKRHWLLALICFGAFWTEVFTVGMSALWQLSPISASSPITLPRQLEVRALPQIFIVPENHEPSWSYKTGVLTQVYGDLFTSFLYSSLNQMVYNGSQPPWSKDGWSFAPINLLPASKQVTSNHPGWNLTVATNGIRRSGVQGNNAPVNVTTETPAVRARLECTLLDTWSNVSSWSTKLDFTNTSNWNTSTLPAGITSGFEILSSFALAVAADPRKSTQVNLLTHPSRVTCCHNGTDPHAPSLASIGYWSTDQTTTSANLNFTIKWLNGKLYNWQIADADANSHLHSVWQDQPSMTALSCLPFFEAANASVTVDLGTLAVQGFSLRDRPTDVPLAWNDTYFGHDPTEYHPPGDFSSSLNVTVSFGPLFMDSLLDAADLGKIAGAVEYIGYGDEDESDTTFKFNMQGLNTDYMSYAAYILADRNSSALLDPPTLTKLSQDIFATFFQHYASINVSSSVGGRTFQPIAAKLPPDLTGFGVPVGNGVDLVIVHDANTPSYTKPTIGAYIQAPAQQLVMSPTAVFLCLGILVFLICTTVIIYFPFVTYFRILPRDVETIGSVLGYTYDSVRLSEWITRNEDLLDGAIANPPRNQRRRYRFGHFWSRLLGRGYRPPPSAEEDGDSSSISNRYNDLRTIKVGMGYFTSTGSTMRWGIELEPVTHGNGKLDGGVVQLAGEDPHYHPSQQPPQTQEKVSANADSSRPSPPSYDHNHDDVTSIEASQSCSHVKME